MHSYGHGNEPSGSANAGDFITGWQLLSYYEVLCFVDLMETV